MIHKKELKFSFNEIQFEAVVSYSDERFENFLRERGSVFWSVKLNKPEVLECGGEVFSVNGMMGRMMLVKSDLKNQRYTYNEDKNYQEKNRINIYPKAIEKVIYMYFNKEIIEEYKQIRLKKEDLKYKISSLKHKYYDRYFECCELKKRYRKG